MSNPADNTELCPVCGLAPHVHGCTPGKCRAPKSDLQPEKRALTEDESVVAEIVKQRFDECCRQGDERSRVALFTAALCVAFAEGKRRSDLPSEKWVLTTRGARPATAAEVSGAAEHPLPWRWTDHDADALIDGDGRVMLVLAPAGPVAPYVRAVTERSGAMEDGLRHLVNYIDHLRRVIAPGFLSLGLMVEHEAMRNLLAEIDAAKAGG